MKRDTLISDHLPSRSPASIAQETTVPQKICAAYFLRHIPACFLAFSLSTSNTKKQQHPHAIKQITRSRP